MVRAKIKDDLIQGKVVIVTGANSGIGKATVEEIVKYQGGTVIMACRTEEKAKAAMEEIKKSNPTSKTDLVFEKLVLNDLKTVMEFVEAVKKRQEDGLGKIDVLINNAGTIFQPPERKRLVMCNHIGHFLLTDALIKENMFVEKHAKVVIVSSEAHKFLPVAKMKDVGLEEWVENQKKYPVNAMADYGVSKMFNIWHMQGLEKRFHTTKDMHFYALHPGAVSTNIGYSNTPGILKPLVWFMNLFFKSPKDGAQTSMHCGFSEKADNESNLYYSDAKVTPYKAEYVEQEGKVEELWALSKKYVNEHLPDYQFADEEENGASTTTQQPQAPQQQEQDDAAEPALNETEEEKPVVETEEEKPVVEKEEAVKDKEEQPTTTTGDEENQESEEPTKNEEASSA